MKRIKGRKFGKLRAIEKYNGYKNTKNQWELVCNCGELRITSLKNLQTGKVKSCGNCDYPKAI